MKDIKEKLKDILEKKYFIFGVCIIDSIIRIESADASLYSCRECTVADTVREDMIGTVFCPFLMKRDLEFKVK